MAAAGLGFKGSDLLPPLRQSEPEVCAVASLFRVEPLLDASPTKAALVGAAGTSNALHISTHGILNAAAPAFQCHYLAPDRDSDGRLFAYEILGLDLGGLDLLTLSACETALGRIDIADNLGGLPASFLLAGVRTLIGTLWEVRPDSSRTFFSSLYAELASGRPKLDAFGAAQRKTQEL